MATQRDLKMLLKPLLARRPDLALVRRYLIIRPFCHYLRGVHFSIERWGNHCSADAFFWQVYDGSTGPSFYSSTTKLERRAGTTFWLKTGWDQDREASSNALCHAIEDRLLPLVQDLTDYRAFLVARIAPAAAEIQEDGFKYWPEILGMITEGCFEEGLRYLAPAIRGMWPPTPEDDMVTEKCRYSNISYYRWAYLRRLLRTDPSAVFPLLHEWEELGVKGMKLEEHWISTPFPGEKERQDRRT
jgi:hypothetical protein